MTVKKSKKEVFDENKLFIMADLFKMFGDSTRLRILTDLYDAEKNVSELSEDLGMTASAISHQLKYLKTGKLVKSRREGKQIFYSLADEHVRTIISMGKDHVDEEG